MKVTFRRVDWEFSTPFRISYRTRTHARTVVVELQDGQSVGRGEAQGVLYHGETAESLLDQLETARVELQNGITRQELQNILPAGGARNAADCALWDLEAKRAGRRAWELGGLPAARPVVTAFTLSVDEPDAMARAAMAAARYSLLKVKLAGVGDLDRVTRIREARPDADLIVDANQAWTATELRELAPRLAELGVKLIEQPLAVADDGPLLDFASPVPLCADESCQTIESLPALVGKYEFINIKLDKTGGLTHGLELARGARGAGLRLMVGCMAGSSLAMAPAFVLAQLCEIADLDGPLLASADVPDPILYKDSQMSAPVPLLWG